jgi:hypothetical protein
MSLSLRMMTSAFVAAAARSIPADFMVSPAICKSLLETIIPLIKSNNSFGILIGNTRIGFVELTLFTGSSFVSLASWLPECSRFQPYSAGRAFANGSIRPRSYSDAGTEQGDRSIQILRRVDGPSGPRRQSERRELPARVFRSRMKLKRRVVSRRAVWPNPGQRNRGDRLLAPRAIPKGREHCPRSTNRGNVSRRLVQVGAFTC